MQSRVLGRTGIEVTSFGLGCAMLGVRMGEVNERTGVEVVATAMKAGVTLLDVAPVYPAVMSGMSERIVGQALKGESRPGEEGGVGDESRPPAGGTSITRTTRRCAGSPAAWSGCR